MKKQNIAEKIDREKHKTQQGPDLTRTDKKTNVTEWRCYYYMECHSRRRCPEDRNNQLNTCLKCSRTHPQQTISGSILCHIPPTCYACYKCLISPRWFVSQMPEIFPTSDTAPRRQFVCSNETQFIGCQKPRFRLQKLI